MNQKPRKVIVDTCILYVIYGEDRKEKTNKPFSRLNNAAKMLYLAQKGYIQIVVTPQVFKEFRMCEGKKPEAVATFAEFVKKYLTVLVFDEKQSEIVSEMVYSFGHDRVKVSDANGSRKEAAFRLAKNPGDRNFADTTIMAEAVMAGLDIVTFNIKDFKGFKFIGSLAEKHGFNHVPHVYSAQDFFMFIRDPKQIEHDAAKETKLASRTQEHSQN